MSKATDTPLDNIQISPCVPVNYSLGPHPVDADGYFLTREVYAAYKDDWYDDVMIHQSKDGWYIERNTGEVLSRKDIEFKFVDDFQDETDYLFESLVEAKTFWYETYIKHLVKTCQDPDSGINGVLGLEKDEEGVVSIVYHDW